MTSNSGVTRMAFGVDPTRPERYSLRQSRYDALGKEVAQVAERFSRQGETLRLLDVGCYNGASRRYIESHPGTDCIEYHGVDIKFQKKLYKSDDWCLHHENLMDGLPSLASESFDVVICEQVLEHLTQIDIAMAALARVVKPGGTLIIGVPIFPEGLHLVRRWLIPLLDKTFLGPKKPRGHVQAWSKRTFTNEFLRHSGTELVKARGFRVISGGLVRFLENYRWWWQANRTFGAVLPGLCTEIQLVCHKPQTAEQQQPLTAPESPDRKAA